MAEIHVGDIGTDLEITVTENSVALDISTAAVRQIILRKPSGASLTKTATFSTDGVDGKIYYSTISGDIDIPGIWGAQAYIELPDWKGYTETSTFPVEANL
jgi:hypothetical protein